MATFAMFLRAMGAGPPLFALAVGLRFACLFRIERLRDAGRLPLLLATLCVVDGLFALARGAVAARPLTVGFDTWLPIAQGIDAGFKVATAAACLLYAKRRPSLAIVAAALTFDACGDVAAIMDGLPTRDLMIREILCWLTARWGLGRVVREDRAIELLAPPAPLWLQAAESSTWGSRPEERA